jgi:hypothetical protein
MPCATAAVAPALAAVLQDPNSNGSHPPRSAPPLFVAPALPPALEPGTRQRKRAEGRDTPHAQVAMTILPRAPMQKAGDRGRSLGQRVDPVDDPPNVPGLDQLAERAQVGDILRGDERPERLGNEAEDQMRPHLAACAPPIGTITTRSASRSRPRPSGSRSTTVDRRGTVRGANLGRPETSGEAGDSESVTGACQDARVGGDNRPPEAGAQVRILPGARA